MNEFLDCLSSINYVVNSFILVPKIVVFYSRLRDIGPRERHRKPWGGGPDPAHVVLLAITFLEYLNHMGGVRTPPRGPISLTGSDVSQSTEKNYAFLAVNQLNLRESLSKVAASSLKFIRRILNVLKLVYDSQLI